MLGLGLHGGMRVIVSSLHCKQERWHGGRPPSKARGRKGTRKAWKQRPHMRVIEPAHALVMQGDTLVVTPRQMEALYKATSAEPLTKTFPKSS